MGQRESMNVKMCQNPIIENKDGVRKKKRVRYKWVINKRNIGWLDWSTKENSGFPMCPLASQVFVC